MSVIPQVPSHSPPLPLVVRQSPGGTWVWHGRPRLLPGITRDRAGTALAVTQAVMVADRVQLVYDQDFQTKQGPWQTYRSITVVRTSATGHRRGVS